MSTKGRTFLGIPYDRRRPTWSRLKQAMWNPDDRRLIVPKAYGIGWTINLCEVARRLRLKR